VDVFVGGTFVKLRVLRVAADLVEGFD